MIQGVDTYFPEIREAYEQKAVSLPGREKEEQGLSFTEMLQKSVGQLDSDFARADNTINEFLSGKKEIQDVLIDMQKVNMEFRLAVQVRNKLVEAYQQIMNMSI